MLPNVLRLSWTLCRMRSEGIFPKFLKILFPFFIRHVLHVFNHAITCSVFSSISKNVIVRPVAKVSWPSSSSDFLLISIISVLS
jgi:hypothetical protein